MPKISEQSTLSSDGFYSSIMKQCFYKSVLKLVNNEEKQLELWEVSGFVTFAFIMLWWWLACVLDTDVDNDEVKLSLLNSHVPSRSYQYPAIPSVVTIPITNV